MRSSSSSSMRVWPFSSSVVVVVSVLFSLDTDGKAEATRKR